MSTVYYKATDMSGKDFHSGTIDYAAAALNGTVIEHPNPHKKNASGYLSVATVPTDCTAASWPCRLWEVEAVEEAWVPDSKYTPNKVATYKLRVIRELPAHLFFGPQGKEVVSLIERLKTLTNKELLQIQAAYNATYSATYDAAYDAAYNATYGTAHRAAHSAAYNAAYNATYGTAHRATYAVRALIVRHLISEKDYSTLTKPLSSVFGKLHPEDKD